MVKCPIFGIFICIIRTVFEQWEIPKYRSSDVWGVGILWEWSVFRVKKYAVTHNRGKLCGLNWFYHLPLPYNIRSLDGYVGFLSGIMTAIKRAVSHHLLSTLRLSARYVFHVYFHCSTLAMKNSPLVVSAIIDILRAPCTRTSQGTMFEGRRQNQLSSL